VARDFPKNRSRHRADERVPPGWAPHRHDEVDRGEHQNLSRDTEEIEEHAGKPAQRPFPPDEVDPFGTHRLERAGDEGHRQQSQAEKKNVEIRYDRGDHEMAPTDHHAVQKDHRHRVFEHGEGERAEEHHRRQQHPADHAAVLQESLQLRNDGR